jgi:hypothetical protein
MKTQETTSGQIIIEQLGGNRFRAMTGARHFVFDDVGQSLTFRLPWPGINFVRVTLTPADLYDMEFFKVRGLSLTLKAREVGIYWDRLQAVFTANTGLDTHL